LIDGAFGQLGQLGQLKLHFTQKFREAKLLREIVHGTIFKARLKKNIFTNKAKRLP